MCSLRESETDRLGQRVPTILQILQEETGMNVIEKQEGQGRTKGEGEKKKEREKERGEGKRKRETRER